ncbi:MAG: hypothetical protein JNK85_24485 [Verrucomicrobiales bacterium]|nr:hypothetical protein [Verrucomicrobiales bacterium]
MALFPLLLLSATRLRTVRQSFYLGLGLGLAIVAPQLRFFWSIFGAAAIVLWLVVAIWYAAFAATGQALHRRLAGVWTVPLIPALWMGFEFFRSELYYLRFAWITPGHALAQAGISPVYHWLGMYGVGAFLFIGPSLFWFSRHGGRWLGLAVTLIGAAALGVTETRPLAPASAASPHRIVQVAGAQIESMPEHHLVAVLDQLLARYPATQLCVLPEYTLDGAPGGDLMSWCRAHRQYLVVGGRELLENGRFRNTAWVIDASGDIVFRQAKSVPIQFFNDGEAASNQAVWSSPWGALGIAICYDLSYTRVMDRLVRQGAEALLIPTMDSLSWGAHQHALHARIAPIRAAEYGIPICRSASSGVSQVVDREGSITSSAPFCEEVAFFAGSLQVDGPGRLPIDRWLAPAATVITAGLIGWLVWPLISRQTCLGTASPRILS